MNTLLADESWWSISQRDRAAKEFAPAIVSAFFDPLEPEVSDPAGIRQKYIPMPDRLDGYTRVLFVGTTGAGKTTLLRHMIGSDHTKDRFPSISTAKTTISDIEVITGDAPFQAIVTFFHEWRVHTNVVECVLDAGLAVWEGETDQQVADRLLHHSDQKFRLSYVLGRWKTEEDSLPDSEWMIAPEIAGDPGVDVEGDDGALSDDERRNCQAFLESVVARIRVAADGVIAELTREFAPEATDPTGPEYDVYQDIFESELEACDAFDEIVKDIMDEVRLRFDVITTGELERRKSGWPQSWRLTCDNRNGFIQQIRWFSSNYAKSFGRLLTPLVDGIRVKGPFYPSPNLTDQRGKFVLIDGQGLGHTPESYRQCEHAHHKPVR